MVVADIEDPGLDAGLDPTVTASKDRNWPKSDLDGEGFSMEGSVPIDIKEGLLVVDPLETADEMEHMEFFLDPIADDGVDGGVAKLHSEAVS